MFDRILLYHMTESQYGVLTQSTLDLEMPGGVEKMAVQLDWK